jgi:hypothetical protein
MEEKKKKKKKKKKKMSILSSRQNSGNLGPVTRIAIPFLPFTHETFFTTEPTTGPTMIVTHFVIVN